MIRAEVSWWPGNVETKGGTHIHHLVWGILTLMVAGYLGLAFEPSSPWEEIIAILFGIGMGLTLDEFALWLNLEDVYWTEKGRQSIDAVIVTTCLLALTLTRAPVLDRRARGGDRRPGHRRQGADRGRERRDPGAAPDRGCLPRGGLPLEGQGSSRGWWDCSFRWSRSSAR